MSYLKEFTKGILKENPNLVMLLGMCPTLAVTTMAENGLGMGLATTFVLVCSNLVISLLKRVIPSQVRLPSFIVIISGFVTLVGMLLQKYIPSLYDALGLFLSLITVNCISAAVGIGRIGNGRRLYLVAAYGWFVQGDIGFRNMVRNKAAARFY